MKTPSEVPHDERGGCPMVDDLPVADQPTDSWLGRLLAATVFRKRIQEQKETRERVEGKFDQLKREVGACYVTGSKHAAAPRR